MDRRGVYSKDLFDFLVDMIFLRCCMTFFNVEFHGKILYKVLREQNTSTVSLAMY